MSRRNKHGNTTTPAAQQPVVEPVVVHTVVVESATPELNAAKALLLEIRAFLSELAQVAHYDVVDQLNDITNDAAILATRITMTLVGEAGPANPLHDGVEEAVEAATIAAALGEGDESQTQE